MEFRNGFLLISRGVHSKCQWHTGSTRIQEGRYREQVRQTGRVEGVSRSWWQEGEKDRQRKSRLMEMLLRKVKSVEPSDKGILEKQATAKLLPSSLHKAWMITQAIQDKALETGSNPNRLRSSCICLNWNQLDLPLSQLTRKGVPPLWVR